jgi:hypothetical protein
VPVIDYENAWYALKARLSEKRSWGTAQIAEAMAQIEVDHRLDERQQGFDDRPPLDHSHEPADGRPVGRTPFVAVPSGRS